MSGLQCTKSLKFQFACPLHKWEDHREIMIYRHEHPRLQHVCASKRKLLSLRQSKIRSYVAQIALHQVFNFS